MSTILVSYKVFIASPGGLNNEREAFRDVIDEFNDTAAKYEGVHFEPVGWETTLGGIGRPQEKINEELRECDFFVLMLSDRWGSQPGSSSAYTSGTEEEYHVAMECHKNGKIRQVVILFKSVSISQLNDPGEQLRKVLDFKLSIERSYSHLYQNFDSISLFQKRLRALLHQWMRQIKSDTYLEREQFITSLNEPILAPPVENQTENSSVADSDSSLIQEAWKLANEGKLTEAEIAFARAIVNTHTHSALMSYGKFLVRLGLLDRAQGLFEDALSIATKHQNQADISDSYISLGSLLTIRGSLDEAENAYYKSLVIEQKIGRDMWLAAIYSSLGNILNMRGKLSEAENMYRKDLNIKIRIGRPDGIAICYSNLGTVLNKRGNLGGAEAMYRTSLEIYNDLDQSESSLQMAAVYGNLGILLDKMGNFEESEAVQCMSLKINERLGRLEGLANNYGCLGILFSHKGDWTGAEKMYYKALEIEKKLGRLPGISLVYCNLGLVLDERGDLDGADALYYKSLAIEEKLGRLEEKAAIYNNLGKTLGLREMLKESIAMYNNALLIYVEMNNATNLSLCCCNISVALSACDDTVGAAIMASKSLTIAGEAGIASHIEAIKDRLNYAAHFYK